MGSSCHILSLWSNKSQYSGMRYRLAESALALLVLAALMPENKIHSMAQGWQPEHIKMIFTMLDNLSDKDELLTRDEIVKNWDILKNMGDIPLKEHALKKAFEDADNNKDGKLCKEEFVNFVKEY